MGQQVVIHSRMEWGAAPPKNVEPMLIRAKRVIIHHTTLPKCSGMSDCTEQLRSIQKTHMEERNYDDIGYNFLVSHDGLLFEGRGWRKVGAHTKENNHDSVGIAFMGNFNEDTPSVEALSAVRQLLLFGVSNGIIHEEFDLLGHRDLNQTECPGDNLYSSIQKLKLLN